MIKDLVCLFLLYFRWKLMTRMDQMASYSTAGTGQRRAASDKTTQQVNLKAGTSSAAGAAPTLKWQRLVNQYGNRLGIGESLTQANQSVEEEFAAYSTSRVVQTDILQFWAVSH